MTDSVFYWKLSSCLLTFRCLNYPSTSFKAWNQGIEKLRATQLKANHNYLSKKMTKSPTCNFIVFFMLVDSVIIYALHSTTGTNTKRLAKSKLFLFISNISSLLRDLVLMTVTRDYSTSFTYLVKRIQGRGSWNSQS